MTDPIVLVRDFIAQWEEPGGLDRAIEACFTAETIWENHGLVTTTGIERALEVNRHFAERLGMATILVDMRAIAVTGSKVLTERMDHILDASGGVIMSAPTMGIFEIDGDKFTAWRDYFDSRHALQLQTQ